MSVQFIFLCCAPLTSTQTNPHTLIWMLCCLSLHKQKKINKEKIEIKLKCLKKTSIVCLLKVFFVCFFKNNFSHHVPILGLLSLFVTLLTSSVFIHPHHHPRSLSLPSHSPSLSVSLINWRNASSSLRPAGAPLKSISLIHLYSVSLPLRGFSHLGFSPYPPPPTACFQAPVAPTAVSTVRNPFGP